MWTYETSVKFNVPENLGSNGEHSFPKKNTKRVAFPIMKKML